MIWQIVPVLVLRVSEENKTRSAAKCARGGAVRPVQGSLLRRKFTDEQKVWLATGIIKAEGKAILGDARPGGQFPATAG